MLEATPYRRLIDILCIRYYDQGNSKYVDKLVCDDPPNEFVQAILYLAYDGSDKNDDPAKL